MKVDVKIIPIAIVCFVGGYYVGLRQLKGHYEFLLDEKVSELDAQYEGLIKVARESAVSDYQTRLAQEEETLRTTAVELAEPYAATDDATVLEFERPTETPSKPEVTDYRTLYPGSNVRVLPTAMSADTVEAPKKSDEPYVISETDFMGNSTEYEQNQFTYFAGDDVLINEADEVIDQREREILVGDALSRFGEMSNDPKIVFVRSDWLRQELEISRDERTYAEVVSGEGDDGP